MPTVTRAIRILRSESPIHVQATEAGPGLYVYQLPETVNPGDPYRWRIGHHTGRAIATAISKQNAIAGAAAIAGLADWAQLADFPASTTGSELAARLRRSNCYRAGY
jgi:hypothetical protein